MKRGEGASIILAKANKAIQTLSKSHVVKVGLCPHTSHTTCGLRPLGQEQLS